MDACATGDDVDDDAGRDRDEVQVSAFPQGAPDPLEFLASGHDVLAELAAERKVGREAGQDRGQDDRDEDAAEERRSHA